MAVRVGLFGPRPDLRPVTLSGWHAPVVPRTAPDAALFSCPEPDTLRGNGPWTWLNTACFNGGTVAADTVSFGLRVDGASILGIRNFSTPLPAGHPRTVLNLDNPSTDLPWTVPGGRHTLSVSLDYLDELSELLEENNLTGRQYCWSPKLLAPGSVISRTAVPPRDGGHADCEPTVTLYPNCDGLRLQHTDLGDVGLWRAAAVMPDGAGRDVDLQLHLPLVGTASGFGPDLRASSASGPGEVDFVLVNYRQAPTGPVDLGVLDAPGNSGHGYTVQDAISGFLGVVQTGELGPFTILGGRMIELHDLWLPAGPLNLRVDDLGGGVDWGLSLYNAAGPAYVGKAGAVGGGDGDQAGPGASEWLDLDVPHAGYYCLAVWKSRADDLATTAPYRLWLTHGATAAPEAPPASTQLVSAHPNPFNPQTVLTYELAGDGLCQLSIHDLQGRTVRSLVSGVQSGGRRQVVFDGRDDRGRPLPSGVYVARLVADGAVDRRKLTLVQ
jgi:hypothetical protein